MTDNKSQVMAEVNGVEITQEDVIELIQNMGQNGSQFLSQEGLEIIANELINQELIYFDAINNNLDEDDDFKLKLEEERRTLLKNYAMYKLFEDIEITDEDVKKYFEENRDKIKSSYSYNADHILLDSEEKANDILEKVNDENFSDLAKEYSSCPSKSKGGNLGQFQSGQMVKEFDEALEEMEEGEIKGPVKTEFGYHIIRLNNKDLIQEANFETMKDQLKQQLLMMKQQELYVDKTKELEKNYEVKRYF